MCRVDPRGLPCREFEAEQTAFKDEVEGEDETGGLVTGSPSLVALRLSSEEE